MSKTMEQIAVVALAVVGVAVVAVLVSGNSRTTDVIGALGRAFSGSLKAALSPVVQGRAL